MSSTVSKIEALREKKALAAELADPLLDDFSSDAEAKKIKRGASLSKSLSNKTLTLTAVLEQLGQAQPLEFGELQNALAELGYAVEQSNECGKLANILKNAKAKKRLQKLADGRWALADFKPEFDQPQPSASCTQQNLLSICQLRVIINAKSGASIAVNVDAKNEVQLEPINQAFICLQIPELEQLLIHARELAKLITDPDDG